jgi:hypothetical protein
MSIARDGAQTAACVLRMLYTWVKEAPAAASLSRLGVRTYGLPHAPMVSARWSSLRMKRMFGSRPACAPAFQPRPALRFPIAAPWIAPAETETRTSTTHGREVARRKNARVMARMIARECHPGSHHHCARERAHPA